MTTQRVAAQDVRGIYPTEQTLQPYIETASLIVEERLKSHYTEARLYEIEKWLSAHFASMGALASGSTSGQVSSVRADEITVSYSTSRLGEGLGGSPYGQHVALLDYKGILAQDLTSIPTHFSVF